MELEGALKRFVHYYNYERYHESLQNVTPADMYYGKAAKTIENRRKIKLKTLNERRLAYLSQTKKQPVKILINNKTKFM
jgi:transposase InsO family protein